MKIVHKIEILVTDDFLNECNDYQKMFTGFDLTPEQMLEVFLWRGNWLLIDSVEREFETTNRADELGLEPEEQTPKNVLEMILVHSIFKTKPNLSGEDLKIAEVKYL